MIRLIKKNKMITLVWGKKPKKRNRNRHIKFFDKDQCDSFLREAEKTRNKKKTAVFHLLYYYAFRASELIKLKQWDL